MSSRLEKLRPFRGATTVHPLRASGRAGTGMVEHRDGSLLEDLAGRVQRLRGWRRALLAAALGALSVLAQAPFHVFPILLVPLTALVWLMDGIGEAPRRRGLAAAARLGWSFGFGYFLVGLHWIGAAFLVEREVFGWLMPFAVAGLAAGLALFFALGLALARLLWSEGPFRIAALAAGLGASEWLRGHVLTGFPWSVLGYGLTAGDMLSQSAAVFGVYGLTVLAVLIFASPAVLADAPGRGRLALPALAALAFAGLLGLGALRLARAEDETVPEVRVRIVQPAIDQRDRWRYENRREILDTFLSLSRRATSPAPPGLDGVTLLVWPESAFPFFLSDQPEALAAIAALLPQGTTLLTGAARYEAPGPGEDGARVFNSLYAIGHQGALLALYDKVHLVPFGEYLPLRQALEALGLRQLTRVRGGFTAGARNATVTLRDAPPFGPLICYEAIFPGAVTDPGNRPGWLLNVTNDAWFGPTIGPHQHLHQARVRAIEEGLPLVRAANTGISATIDAHGRIRQALALGAAGVIDDALPRALPATPYARYGDLLFAGLLAAAAGASLAARARPARHV